MQPAITRDERFSLLGVGVSTLDLAGAVDFIADAIRRHGREYICTCPVYTLMRARESPEVLAALDGAGVVAADGMGVVWAMRWLGQPVSRVYGPDLVQAVCAAGLDPGWRHYFYGGRPGVAEAAAHNLAGRFSGLVVAGTACPPFRDLSAAEAEAETRAINRARPQVVWVGLGSPKQDLWCAASRTRLEAPVLIAVGAAFDFIAGTVRQAPRWVQRSGLEWAFRLAQEPRRLRRRYLVYNPLFVWEVLRQRTRRSAHHVSLVPGNRE
jgi:N-acetylglucosaminyldiphosphoundecaprenol N-acetyl-beta-D-mannosaminyltransferase